MCQIWKEKSLKIRTSASSRTRSDEVSTVVCSRGLTSACRLGSHDCCAVVLACKAATSRLHLGLQLWFSWWASSIDTYLYVSILSQRCIGIFMMRRDHSWQFFPSLCLNTSGVVMKFEQKSPAEHALDDENVEGWQQFEMAWFCRCTLLLLILRWQKTMKFWKTRQIAILKIGCAKYGGFSNTFWKNTPCAASCSAQVTTRPYLGGAFREFCILLSKCTMFFDFCRIWHLGGFGHMENTPTVCADDLPSILGIIKKSPNR